MTDPTAAERLLHQAALLHANGDAAGAEEVLTAILRDDPGNLWAAVRLADLAIERHDAPAALTLVQGALQRQPNFPPALAALAEAHWLAGRPAEALAPARRAVEIQPAVPQFRLTLAQLCGSLGHAAEARAALQPLLESALHDDAVRGRAFSHLAELLVAQGDFAEADTAFERALALAPGSAVTHMAYGMNLLRQGRFEDGWREYQWRLAIPFLRPRDAPLPTGGRAGATWTGQNIAGRNLLIYDDQGFGDAIQFFRYVPQLRQRAPARLMLRTYRALVSLFATAAPYASVVTEVPADFRADYHCASTSLPFVFNTGLDDIPAPIPYLAPPPVNAAPMLRKAGRFQVGLVWSGDRQHLRDHLRSIPASRFLQLAELDGIGFHSLQREVRSEDIAALEAHPNVSRIGERLYDWGETAAIIMQLDLVIAVDTAVVHLAGALGKPIWVLLPLAPDWRWMTKRDDSPWYPSVRLFRAGRGGWDPLLRRVRQALLKFVA